MVIVAYGGVHEAFQIAMAAREAGVLEVFYGSLFDAPGKWGRRLGRIVGKDRLASRRFPGPDATRLSELPFPFLLNRLAGVSCFTRGWYPWYQAYFDFDGRVAMRLQESTARIFVGTEACARNSFQAAGKRGMIKILDCPQAHPESLTRILARAADDLGLPPPPRFDPPELAARKAEEFAMADVLLLCSATGRRSFAEAGFASERLVEIPLWVDPDFWFPSPVERAPPARDPLKVLFVGSVDLRKGIPYLLRAADQCGRAVQLTLVGANSGDTGTFIRQCKSKVVAAGTKNKRELREIYWRSDVLVLPSLVDTFGFAAIEAMACGLPVIVTENCGVPVPDPAWRVPIMNSDAIAERLDYYAANQTALKHDGQLAAEFSRQYTPQRYREQIKRLLRRLLGQ